MRDVELFILTGIIVTLILIAFIVSFLLINQKRHFGYLKEKQNIQSQFQQTLLSTQLEIQEQTLKNVSQEIHDNIGQVLSLAKLHINTLGINLPMEYQEKITDSKTLISKAIQDLRDLSRTLNTDFVIEAGLVRSVEYELELIKRTGSIKTQLCLTGQPYRIEAQHELILFRMVQEALNNIIKHANAKQMIVQMKFEPGMFTLIIEDDGVGMNTNLIEEGNFKGSGLGLRNMYNRAKIIMADLKIESVLGKRTLITIVLPLDK